MIKKISSFLFENKTLKQTIAKNTFWLFGGQITGKIIRLFIVIYAARILGINGWGEFSYAISIVGFFAILSDMGINNILTREISKRPELQHQYFSTAFFIKIFLLISSAILILIATPFFLKHAVLILIPMATLLFMFDSLREFSCAYIRTSEKMQIETLINIVTNISIVTISFVMLLISPTSYSLIIGHAIGSAIGLIHATIITKNQFSKIFHNFQKDFLKPIAYSSLTFAILGALVSLMVNIDTIMLGLMKKTAEVGLYSAAQKPIQLFFIIPSLFITSLFPTFSRLSHKNETDRFRSIFERIISFTFLISVPLIIGGLILAKSFILFVYGTEYLRSTIPFQVLLLVVLWAFPGTIIINAIVSYDKQKSLILISILGTLGNVVLNYMLIPPFGPLGAAIATVFAQILINSFAWWKLKQMINFKIIMHLPKIIIASGSMALIMLIIKSTGVNFIINAGISALVYFLTLYLLKEKIIKEIMVIFQSQNKTL